MNSKCLVVVLIVVTMASCGRGENGDATNVTITKEEQRNELYQQVIVIHDEVMPKMEDIINLQDKIRIQLDSLIEIDSTSERIIILQEMNLKLESADKSMMNWMREFDVDMNSDEVNQDEAIEYLENEMRRIEEVKEVVNTSIEEVQRSIREE